MAREVGDETFWQSVGQEGALSPSFNFENVPAPDVDKKKDGGCPTCGGQKEEEKPPPPAPLMGPDQGCSALGGKWYDFQWEGYGKCVAPDGGTIPLRGS